METAMKEDLLHLFQETERQGRYLTTRDRSLRRRLERLVERRVVAKPLPHLYARTTYLKEISAEDRHLHAMRALARLHPSWVFARGSAALAHGLFVDRALIQRVQVASRYCRVIGGVEHRPLETTGQVTVRGVAVTSLAQTVFDCLRVATFTQGLGIADSGLAALNMTRAELAAAFRERWPMKHGIGHALRTLAYANPLSESGGESYVRARIIQLGFAVPRIQVPLPDPLDPRKSYRVDLLWELPDGRTIGGEVDGLQKYDSTGDRDRTSILVAERQRESRLTLGLDAVFRITPRQAESDWYLENLLRTYGVPRVSRR